MNFQKFVHRSTKGLFLFIAIMMIIPLVLWGYMGKTGSEKDTDEQVGTIFETIPVGKGQFNDQKKRAYPAYYWRMVRRNPQMVFMMLQGRRMPDPPAEEIAKIARQNIVLLEDAKEKGIPAATPMESRHKFQEVWQAITFGRFPATEDNLQAIAVNIFHASRAIFEAWIDDLVVIDKLLGMMSGSEFADYDKVYDRVLSEQQSVKVTYLGIDPASYVREVKPPRTEEIAKYYEANKSKFKTPEKVRIDYLMADYDEIKKKAPEPTPDEIKKYYEDHKSEFQKPVEHKHAPGEEHKDDEKPPDFQVKPFEEVQSEIPDRVKRKWAEEKAEPVVNAANTALGEAFISNNSKYPETIFDDLRIKYRDEMGLELTHDITSQFDRKHVDEIEKMVGTGSGLEAWAFDSKQKEGDISKVTSTSKGKAFFKLMSRKAPDENPGVTTQNREAIVKELQREQLKKRAQQQANAVVEEIKAHGIAEARHKFPGEWRSTRYFRTDFSGDPGIEDRSLGNAIRMQAGRAKPGEALVLQGSAVSREKQDWSYVLYVDDVVAMPPESVEAKFQEVRRELDTEARERFQESYINTIVFRANIKGLEAKDVPAGVPAQMPDDDHDHDHN